MAGGLKFDAPDEIPNEGKRKDNVISRAAGLLETGTRQQKPSKDKNAGQYSSFSVLYYVLSLGLYFRGFSMLSA